MMPYIDVSCCRCIMLLRQRHLIQGGGLVSALSHVYFFIFQYMARKEGEVIISGIHNQITSHFAH